MDAAGQLPGPAMNTAFPSALTKAVEREPVETTILLDVNGDEHHLKVEPFTTLLDLLREDLHLTDTKKGCDHGQCGACTVIVDGRRVNSCLELARSLDGARVTTVEGL